LHLLLQTSYRELRAWVRTMSTVRHLLLLRLVMAPLWATSLPSCCSREKSCSFGLAFSASFCGSI
jgi:hypothetical protein